MKQFISRKMSIKSELPQFNPSKSTLSNIQSYYQSTPTHTLFEFQSKLPKLPVPKLQDTLTKYLQSLKPIIPSDQYNRTQSIIQQFLKDPISNTLQDRLIQKSTSKYGWLHELWLNYAYLEWRERSAGNVNFFYQFKKFSNSQSHTAALLIREMMGFRQTIFDHSLSPEMNKDTPLCSHMYNYLFNTTRIPLKPRDQVTTQLNTNHIVVFYRHHLYTLNPIINNQLLSVNEIKHQINQILNQDEYGPGLGALTSWHRDEWSNVYHSLLNDPINSKSLAHLQSAAFVLCLDESAPISLEQSAIQLLYGDIKNRWFDKSIQLIVCQNGVSGFNNEHSQMDGTINSRLADTILTHIFNQPDHGTDSLSASQLSALAPTRLPFHISPQIQNQISHSVSDFQKWANAHYCNVLAYYGHGKSLIKTFKISPDAYIQMALQLAYFKLHGKVVPTYESAQIRKYQYGRTETCRSTSTASTQFVHAMENPQMDKLEKTKYLKLAIQAHAQYMKDAVNGYGVDRHLLGLKHCLLPNEPIPSIFQDLSYSVSCHWKMSTSQLSSEYYDGYGWVEVVPDGYGLAYCIKNESIHVNMMGMVDCSGMRQKMVEALEDMKWLLMPSSKL
eukprot:NODE_518_length_6556_cov_0.505653.p1 type:complete len:614 gc:universal NODE_518_length_6556_cov_0.505653:3385-5226(+)